MGPPTRSQLPTLPLLAMAGLLIALLLLDLAFEASLEVLAAFVPAAIWAGVILVRGRS